MLRRAGRLWRVLVPELVPLAALTLVVLYAVGPFLTGEFRGGTDAQWYFCLLADALHQVRAGVFPVQVGQSPANWNGHPTALLPGYLITGVVIDLVTAGRCTVAQVQHLTGAGSIWAGALAAYFCLRSLVPSGGRWLPTVLAGLYVCCPAVLCLLATGDMYPALISVPYYPVLLYGLVRAARRADGAAAAGIAGALALVWMAHAGIALWCTTGAGLFLVGRALFSGHFWPTVRFALGTGALFLVLSAWYFGSIFALGLHQSHTMNQARERTAVPFAVTGPGYANIVTKVLEQSLPGAYLPLPEEQDGLAIQQLGYALLALLAFATVVAVRVPCLELRLFVAGALGLLASVTPVPHLTWTFWANLPRPFLITEWWPMTRFGLLLAGLIVFAAALAAERVLPARGGHLRLTVRGPAPLGTAPARQYVLPVRTVLAALSVLLLLGLTYSLREVGTVRRWVHARSPLVPRPLLSLPENMPLSWYNWIALRDPHAAGAEPAAEINVKDLYLYDRVLARDGAPLVANGDAARRGAAVPFVLEGAPPFEATPASGPRPVVRFRIEPGRHYLLTLHTAPRNGDASFRVEGGTLGHRHRPPYNGLRPQTVVIPIWTSGSEPHEVRVSAVCLPRAAPEPAAVAVEPVSLVSFDPDELPVRVRALMPYTVTVRTDRPGDLETHREYVPGYEARVNGARVEPARAPNGMLTVPLPAGDNEVVLVYRGQPLARAARVVSALGWLALAGFAAHRGRGRGALG